MCEGDTVVDVAPVEEVLACLVVGDAWFPPPLEHPTRRATIATHAPNSERLANITFLPDH